MDVTRYLRRIGVKKIGAANLQNLKQLQLQHLLNIPFENLDIHRQNTISLDPDLIFKKVVENKRGGFCYELNGLFWGLLKAHGYDSRMLSARVHKGSGAYGEEFDHLCILTKLGEIEYLVDVGFGDFAVEPLEFSIGKEQMDRCGIFVIREYDERYFDVMKDESGVETSQYIFSITERRLEEFEGMCRFHQTSPDSTFTQKKVCSILTESGRKTLTADKFITSIDGNKTERIIDFNQDFEPILAAEFGIKL